jgi:hypothetical protein
MPWTAKQLKLFRAAAHNPAIAKSSGIKQADAERMSKEGLKKAAGGLAKIGKQDTRHGKTDLPFTKLNRFAGMRSGGNVKKYAKGDVVRLGEEGRTQSFGQAFKEALDADAGTFTWRGKKYTTEVAKGGAKPEFPRGFLERARKSEDQATSEANRIAGEVDRLASNYPNPRGRDVSQDELSKYSYRKGGSVESKAMVKKEVAFMKKKGAPASMIKHEAAEMGGMKKGGMMRSKKDIAADQMAMAPYKKGGAMKMARGGGIESRGKTKGTIVKMAGGGYVKAADGCATKGKTKGKMV